MILKVFSARDMKAEAFLQPFFMPTSGAALRAFGDACSKEDSPFFIHPNDYVLYEIGSYDDSDGLLVATSPVKMMACAADFVVKGVSFKQAGKDVTSEVFQKAAVLSGENHGS